MLYVKFYSRKFGFSFDDTQCQWNAINVLYCFLMFRYFPLTSSTAFFSLKTQALLFSVWNEEKDN